MWENEFYQILKCHTVTKKSSGYDFEPYLSREMKGTKYAYQNFNP
jgi:hypothetical protein